MRSKLTTVIILLAGIIAAAGIYHYLPLTKSSPTTTEVQPTQTVTVATFAQRTIPTTAHAYGSIISPRSVDVGAKTNGVVSAVYFKAGQTLQKGDLLFKVESNNTTNQLKQLAANLQLAKTTYDNYVKANELAPGSISQLDINTKKADYLTALTAYQVAKSQFYIKAPVHGIASDTELAIGSSVSENDTLMTVIDLSSIELKYTLPSQYSHLVAKGQDLTFIANNHKRAYAAKVSYISPSMTLEDDNITLRATFDTPPPLKPNTFGHITQIIDPTHQAIALPQTLLQSDEAGFFLYTVENNKVTHTPVTTGSIDDKGFIEIAHGITTKTQVITSNPSALNVGQHIKVTTQ